MNSVNCMITQAINGAGEVQKFRLRAVPGQP